MKSPCFFIHLFNFLFILSLSFKNHYLKSKIERRPFDVFKRHVTFIEAHRGMNRELPQNTIIAFQRCILYEVESFETDVWLTKDNIPVIIHGGDNGEIDRTFDHEGIVTELTWEELSKYRTKEMSQPMPRLDETFELIKGKIFINLEIKDPRANLTFPVIISYIEKYDMFDQLAISSFHHEYYTLHF